MRLFLAIPAIIVALAIATPVLAQTSPSFASGQPGIISISGEGEINAAPDMAFINSGVVTTAKTAREALTQNTVAMANLVLLLTNSGIDERDIQTSNFSVSPQYSYNSTSNNSPPKIVGYRVSNSLSVAVRDLNILGDIIDRAVSVGANSINSVSFALDDPSSLLAEARNKAMANAIGKAQLYAAAANVELGRIRLISENAGFMPQPQAEYDMVRMAAKASPVPMQAGELTYRATVSVQWELEQ